MSTPSTATQLGFTPFSDPRTVVTYLRPTLERLASFFTAGCDLTARYFETRSWTFDANLFAYLVRKEVFQALKASGDDVEEELEIADMPLCGLLLKKNLVHLRIRKSKDTEVPLADSEQLLAFYNWNLFAFSNSTTTKEVIPLHLVLLWDADSDRRLRGFWLVCIEGQGKHVKWHWREPIQLSGVPQIDHGQEYRRAFEAENSDLPITARDNEQKKVATATDKKLGK